MDVIIASDEQEAGRIAAAHIAHAIRGIDEPVLGVATGSSPLSTYEDLARRVKEGSLDFSKARAFALDEYVGIPADNPLSYADTIRTTVTEPLGFDPANVRTPDGMANDIAAGAKEYDEAIQGAGGIDVQILGIGNNGHIGFNEPGSSLVSRTRQICLTRETREANARYFSDPADVPTHAVSQGLGTIMEARKVVLVALGEQKAAAIAAACEGPLGAHCPATLLQMHPNATIIVDEAAAGELRRADYFRDVQRLLPESQRIPD
ncbi:glucosamine-6-phosphate deaminase [Luteococcus sp. Sow4_B9]|uniref:glucosamine-6-phosphate deaminase n=1 Tax=Luteococcus sp. Sow4_B9 TaxID=3438792 RepID=UPI003F9657F0